MELTFERTGLVFDTTCLSHFAIADRIDVLGDFVRGVPCRSTSVVFEEIRRGLVKHPELRTIAEQEWITFERIDASIDRLAQFVHQTTLLGTQNGRNLGEASVVAVAQELEATAIVDDLGAKLVARRHYDHVHGTLWLLAEIWRVGKATEVELCNLVDLLAGSGMRLPCKGTEFPNFVKGNKIGPWAGGKR
ncbi:hypothetical protein [Glycomyces sp. NPDC048151]|uniref:hypothetical protein n=1 Tax=Glycomyces sp. NPDC048151 TaxID=3364002 RepID=UPI00371DCF3F